MGNLSNEKKQAAHRLIIEAQKKLCCFALSKKQKAKTGILSENDKKHTRQPCGKNEAG